jgi:hypothetical protein
MGRIARLLLRKLAGPYRRKIRAARSESKPLAFPQKPITFRASTMGGVEMNLSAPTTPVFVVSLILAVLAILGAFVAIPLISPNAFWVAILAYIVLMVGNLAKGL